MDAEEYAGLELDKIIHERARLMILTYLASTANAATPFSEIKTSLGFTSGNLSIQLKNLEKAGYVAITKEFRDNKPLTTVALTEKGGSELQKYIAEMETLIGALKKKND